MTRESPESFTYSSEPHSAPRLFSQSLPNRGVPLTLMSDPRVIRGNTHSMARKVAKSRLDVPKKEKVKFEVVSDEPSPAPYYNFTAKLFSDNEVDVFKNLVEPEDTISLKKEVHTQVDQLRTPLRMETYIPSKTGVDKSTQIEDTKDLFVFDLEVQPMLNVIVQKTIEQALMEVEHEHELTTLQSEVSRYEEQMCNEANWIEEQENHIKQKHEDIRNQLNSILLSKSKERTIKLGIAGVQMMQQLLPLMFDKLCEEFVEIETWYRPENENVSCNLMPHVLKECNNNLSAQREANVVIDEILLNAADKFDRIERKERKPVSIKLIVNIVMTEQKEENDEGQLQEEARPQEKIKEIELEFPLQLNDSVMSLQRRLQENLKNILGTVSNEEKKSIETSFTNGEFSLLPKIEACIGGLYDKAGLPRIQLSFDAILLNFPLQDDLVVFFHI